MWLLNHAAIKLNYISKMGHRSYYMAVYTDYMLLEEYHRAAMAYCVRSEEECMAPFATPCSVARKAGLKMISIENKKSTTGYQSLWPKDYTGMESEIPTENPIAIDLR